MAVITGQRRNVVILIQRDNDAAGAGGEGVSTWRVTSVLFQEAASPTVAQSTSTASKEAALQTRLAALEADEPVNSSGGGGNTWNGASVRAIVDVSSDTPFS